MSVRSLRCDDVELLLCTLERDAVVALVSSARGGEHVTVLVAVAGDGNLLRPWEFVWRYETYRLTFRGNIVCSISRLPTGVRMNYISEVRTVVEGTSKRVTVTNRQRLVRNKRMCLVGSSKE